MKTYELIQRQRLYINMEKLVDDVVDYLATEYEPEEHDQIDSFDVESAIEYAIDCQVTITLCSEYDNWNEILEDIANDIANYINTHNIQDDLIPIILQYIVQVPQDLFLFADVLSCQTGRFLSTIFFPENAFHNNAFQCFITTTPIRVSMCPVGSVLWAVIVLSDRPRLRVFQVFVRSNAAGCIVSCGPCPVGASGF